MNVKQITCSDVKNLLRQSFCITCKNRRMKTFGQTWIALLALLVTFSSCEVVGGIFKAGMGVGIFVVVLVVVLIIWLVTRMRR